MNDTSTELDRSRRERRPDLLEETISPEALALKLTEQVRSDVSRFEDDVAAGLESSEQSSRGLDAAVVERARSVADVDALPGLVRDAHALGDRAVQLLDDRIAIGGQPASARLHRALGRPSAIAEGVRQLDIVPSQGSEKPRETVVTSLEKPSDLTDKMFSVELVRLERELELAKSVEKLETTERMEQPEVERIVGALSGRGWHKLFSDVKPGDALVSFLVPNDPHFSIKHLNDVLFGPQRTDNIIGAIRASLRRELHQSESECVATSYKDAYYRMPKDAFLAQGKERAMQVFSEAAERVRKTMTVMLMQMAADEWATADEKRRTNLDEFVQSMVGDQSAAKFAERRGDYLSSQKVLQHLTEEKVNALLEKEKNESNDPETVEQLDAAVRRAEESVLAAERLMLKNQVSMANDVAISALDEHPGRGYRMTFGLSEVGESHDESVGHIEGSVSESLKGAMLVRHTPEKIGSAFSKEDAERAIEHITQLRDAIGLQDLLDTEGRVYPIFENRPDGQGKTVSVMNLDLIREIRKDTFKPVSDSQQLEVYRLVKSYIEAINIFDVTKPYTHEEMIGAHVYGSDQSILSSVKRSNDLMLQLRKGEATPEERREIAGLLRQDGKDRTCTSISEFHQKALEISNCSYISLDVLDVGPELLQEYELLSQRVANGRMTFEEAQVIAGDATTKKMRDFRSKVTEIVRSSCHGYDPIMSVGGDEIVLAMDTAKVTDDFILKLRQIRLSDDRREGSVRVVQTAVGTGQRQSDADMSARSKEHLSAMKRAETGTTIAKKIEKNVRKIQAAIYDLPQEDRASAFAALHEMNLSEFAVHEKIGGGFDLIVRDPSHPHQTVHVDLEEKLTSIQTSLSGLRSAAEEHRRLFYDEYVQKYPKLTREMIPVALRRKDLGGFEEFMSHFE